MDIRQLRHFVAVAEELHFGRAAERLHMTQPPLSQSIQSLERELGVELFARTKRRVMLTPVGEQWLAHVHDLLQRMEVLPQIAVRLARGEIGTLSLAFVSTANYTLLPMLARRFKRRFPHVQLSLREATSDVQIDEILGGRLQTGLIIPSAGFSHPSLAYHSLLSEPLVAAVPEAWVATGRQLDVTGGILDFKSVLDAPLILFPRHIAPAFHDIVMGYYATHEARPQMGQEAVQMQTIVSLVSAELGIALVPQSLRSLARPGVTYLPLAGEPPRLETGLVWRQDDRSPALQHFVRMATAAVPEGEGPE